MESKPFLLGTTWILILSVHHTLAGSNYGTYINYGYQNINSPQIEVKIDRNRGSFGKCQYRVLGRGVDDTFVQLCPSDITDFEQINSDNYYAYLYKNYIPLGLYTDLKGTLVIVKPDGCLLRTYQPSLIKVTNTESTLNTGVCDKIKMKLADEMARLNDYWAKWEVNFERKMNHLPPAYDIVDPLEHQPPTESLYGQSGVSPPSGPTPNPPAQPVAQNLPPQPLTSQSKQPKTPSPQTGGPTILGLKAIETESENSVNNPIINAYSNVYNNGNQCTLERYVKGNGVHDCFKLPCPKNSATSISFNGFILWGHPDVNHFSFFSNERATLYLFEGGWCTKKTYTTRGRMTSSKSELLSAQDCVKAKNLLKRQGITVDHDGQVSLGDPVHEDSTDDNVNRPSTTAGSQGLPAQPASSSNDPDSETQDITSKLIKVSTSFLKTSHGQCQVEISVVGRGVKDKFTEPCSDTPVDFFNTDDVFTFGDPRKDSLSLYLNEPGILYIIKNKICTKKTFTTTNGETKSIRSPLRLGKCNELKKKIFTFLAKASTSSLPIEMRSSQAETAEGIAVVTPTPADLQQFKPTYPFKLASQGKDFDYDMTANMYIDSFNVRGCYYYITAKGKGVNDHFQVPCTNEGKNTISTGDFMLFGTPTSLLGLYSDSPSTLIIMTKGTCFKKTYGVTPTGPTLMGRTDCEEAKRRMDSNGHQFDSDVNNNNNHLVASSVTRTATVITDDDQEGPSPLFEHPLFGQLPFDFHPRTSGQFDHYDQQPQPPSSSSTALGVSWREGNYWRIYSFRFEVYFETNGMGQCRVEVVGRGVNDMVQDSCSVLGDNIKMYERGYILAVADPSKQSGLYTDEWGVLVLVREGQCFKKTYDTEIHKHTKIITKPMSFLQCNQVKDSISATMGVNFGPSSDNLQPRRAGNLNKLFM